MEKGAVELSTIIIITFTDSKPHTVQTTITIYCYIFISINA